MAGDNQDIVSAIGGAVSSLFSSKGNTAQANSYTSAAQLEQQNAQLQAASTKIQETQIARSVALSAGTTQADVAGAGFTMSGSALDLMKSSAQQGSLAKSLVNIQGAISENSYASEAGTYLAKAKAANEAQTAGTIGAIASVGGALLSGGTQLVSAGKTVASGYNYITGLFAGGTTDAAAGNAAAAALTGQTVADVATGGAALGTGGDSAELMSILDGSISTGATLDTSAAVLGSSAIVATDAAASAAAAVGADAAASLGVDVAASVGADAAGAIATDAAVSAGVDAAAAAGGTSILGDIATAALAFIGSVICTAFYKRGMVSREIWVGAQRYGQALDPATFNGYVYWARPVAKRIAGSVIFARLLAPVFIPPVREMAFLTGRKDVKRTVYGILSHRVLLGLSWIIGRILEVKKHATTRA